MKYRQSLTEPGYEVNTTKAADGSVQDVERPVTIAGANEAMIYRRKLKTILDQMITANPALQKFVMGDS